MTAHFKCKSIDLVSSDSRSFRTFDAYSLLVCVVWIFFGIVNANPLVSFHCNLHKSAHLRDDRHKSTPEHGSAGKVRVLLVYWQKRTFQHRLLSRFLLHNQVNRIQKFNAKCLLAFETTSSRVLEVIETIFPSVLFNLCSYHNQFLPNNF